MPREATGWTFFKNGIGYVRLTLAVAAALVVLACGSDPGAQPGAAERVCQLVAQCPEISALKTYDECVKELTPQLDSELQSCQDCWAGLTCAGLATEISAPTTGPDPLCPTCR